MKVYQYDYEPGVARSEEADLADAVERYRRETRKLGKVVGVKLDSRSTRTVFVETYDMGRAR